MTRKPTTKSAAKTATKLATKPAAKSTPKAAKAATPAATLPRAAARKRVVKKAATRTPAAKKGVVSKALPVNGNQSASSKGAATTVRKAVGKSASPASKLSKPKKPKQVRDSFTMPEAEYALIAQVKKACVAAGFEIKKSELLRIGVALISQLDTKKIKAAQAALVPLKAGRPKKHK